MEEAIFSKPNADIQHLLDSLVSALAVYATAFRSKLSLHELTGTRDMARDSDG